MGDIAGRRYLVTGVLNDESFAWHAAAELQRRGAEVILTSFGRSARIAQRVATQLPRPVEVLELDATKDTDFDFLAKQVRSQWASVDGILHCIASAPESALNGNFMTSPGLGVMDGFRISVHSLQQLTAAFVPLLSKSAHGGSVVGMTVDAKRAMQGYDWMGVYKSALESAAQYLAAYLGPSGIRINLVASGPFESLSGRGISSFDSIADHYERWAPLGWDRRDPGRAVGAVVFLLSDLSRWTTGSILHADGGMHAVLGGIVSSPQDSDSGT